MAIKRKVIDVSVWQGKIDWEAAKKDIDGAILRCGYGSDIERQDDETFHYNARECTRLGIPFGVYLYSYADSREKAESEAAHILRLIKPYTLSYPVYLDCEENKASIQKFAKEACQIVGEKIEAAGYWFGVYANLNWWENYLDGLEDYTKWVAQYYPECTYTGKYDMWQYTSLGTVAGFGDKDVDVNWCYADFPMLIHNVKFDEEGNYVKPEPKPETKPVSKETVYVVKAGDTLSEIAAKHHTTYQAIAAYNNISNPNMIHVGQKIRIPNGTTEVKETVYVVKSGDTLSGIAAKYGTTYKVLAAHNGISNPNLIHVGQKIRIPK